MDDGKEWGDGEERKMKGWKGMRDGVNEGGIAMEAKYRCTAFGMWSRKRAKNGSPYSQSLHVFSLIFTFLE